MTVRNPQEIHAAFEKAFNAGDLDGLVALYEKDAVLAAAPGQPVAAGRDAIREAYRSYLAARPVITVATVAVFENADLALLHGRWERKSDAIHNTGRNSEVVRRQADGTWLFVIDNPFTPD
jgi:uncharacterized protein (TIGR02246 family)